MAKLYIANITKHRNEFTFRVPESNRPRTVPIASGEQMVVANEAPEVIRSIVDQHAQYGLTHVADIDRTRAFIGLCYDIDKAIPVTAIRRGAQHNDSQLEKMGAELRKQAAVAFHVEQAKASGVDVPGRFVEADVEIVEDEQPGRSVTIHETTQVREQGRDAPKGNGRRRAA